MNYRMTRKAYDLLRLLMPEAKVKHLFLETYPMSDKWDCQYAGNYVRLDMTDEVFFEPAPDYVEGKWNDVANVRPPRIGQYLIRTKGDEGYNYTIDTWDMAWRELDWTGNVASKGSEFKSLV